MFEVGSQTLRHHILNEYQMPFFYSFENRDGMFPDVDSRYKFAMMQILKKNPTESDVISSAYYLTRPEAIEYKSNLIPYSTSLLKQLSPDQWAMMELHHSQDLQILSRCYQSFMPLNEGWLDFRNELHMTGDKDIFIEAYQDGLLPLYKGEMIWQFSDQQAPPQVWIDQRTFDERTYSKEVHRMAQAIGKTKNECEAHYSHLVKYDREYFRLGFRAIASDTNERTFIFAMLPKNCGAGHSLFVSIPKNYILKNDSTVVVEEVSPIRILFAMAWLNSLTVDWIARYMIQINVSKSYLFRVPMPQPSDDEILSNSDYFTLAKNALILTLSYNWDDFAELAPVFGISKENLPQMQKPRDKLRYANDMIVARMYGINKTDLHHIIESFTVMKNKRPEYIALFND